MTTSFKYTTLIEEIKADFIIDFYGTHGMEHWERVYQNTQILSAHYEIESEVFELFALLHDSKREDEFEDKHHGRRASLFARELLDDGVILLSDEDAQRLIYACANHTYSDKSDPLFGDRVVQICLDSDRLDIGRVGYEIDVKYLATKYARKLVINGLVQ